jgi:hypothetical protein
MADDDPPPNVDRTVLDDLDPAVRDFLAAMDIAGTEKEKIGSEGRKLFNYKTLLYLSVDDPDVPLFAKWLNELSKFSLIYRLLIVMINFSLFQLFFKMPISRN